MAHPAVHRSRLITAAVAVVGIVAALAMGASATGGSDDQNSDGTSDAKAAALSSARQYSAESSPEQKKALRNLQAVKSHATIAAWISAHSTTAAKLTEGIAGLKQFASSADAAGDFAKAFTELGQNAELIVVGDVVAIGLDGTRVRVTMKATAVMKGLEQVGSTITISVRASLDTDQNGEVVLGIADGDALPPAASTVIYIADTLDARYFGQPGAGLYLVQNNHIVPLPGCRFADNVTGLSLEQFLAELS